MDVGAGRKKRVRDVRRENVSYTIAVSNLGERRGGKGKNRTERTPAACVVRVFRSLSAAVVLHSAARSASRS